jgi:hypothetical protein
MAATGSRLSLLYFKRDLMGYSVHSGRHSATEIGWVYKPSQDTTGWGDLSELNTPPIYISITDRCTTDIPAAVRPFLRGAGRSDYRQSPARRRPRRRGYFAPAA